MRSVMVHGCTNERGMRICEGGLKMDDDKVDILLSFFVYIILYV
jgi:hypothetical protein